MVSEEKNIATCLGFFHGEFSFLLSSFNRIENGRELSVL